MFNRLSLDPSSATQNENHSQASAKRDWQPAIDNVALIREKVAQAVDLLDEFDLDMWITFVRETSAVMDPALTLIFGHDVVAQAAVIVTRSGERIVIIGHIDVENAHRLGVYSEVIPYQGAFSQPLRDVLKRYDPQKIALNYSVDDPHADGLTYGLFQLLNRYLAETPYAQRLVSAEPLLMKLRGRKTHAEIARIRRAIDTTFDIYDETFEYAEPGMTARQIGQFMHDRVLRAASRRHGNGQVVQPSTQARIPPLATPAPPTSCWNEVISFTSTLAFAKTTTRRTSCG